MNQKYKTRSLYPDFSEKHHTTAALFLFILILMYPFLTILITGCAPAPRFTHSQLKTPVVKQYDNESSFSSALPSVVTADSQEFAHTAQQSGNLQKPNIYREQVSDLPKINETIPKDFRPYTATGRATYYANKFHGHKTASGERYNKYELTAAHRTLPYGTRVKVTNTRNDNSVIVRVNDRGPFSKNLLIDVSYAAAQELNMITAGVIPVTVETLP